MCVKITALFITVFSLFAASAVRAQTAGVVTLRANATSGQGSLVPLLTWSTNPVATSCSASGGWSGSMSTAGTQTLPSISASTNYTLTCIWSAGSAVVSWTAPTTNSDGSVLIDLSGFRVYYGASSTALIESLAVGDMTSRSAMVTGLTPGTWFFAVRSLNSRGVESTNSNVASQTVAGASAASTVSITITSAPPPPPPPPAPATRRTIATTVYDVIRGSNGRWVLGRPVGTIPIGKPCRSYYLSGDYYGVLSRLVTITTRPRTATLVAHCAIS